MAKRMKINWIWVGLVLAIVAVVIVVYSIPSMSPNGCPGSQVYCPGVGCVSGQDKCFAGSQGGASAVFSKETFKQWPGPGVTAKPPFYEAVKEKFVNKKCPDGTRTDGPCLMEF